MITVYLVGMLVSVIFLAIFGYNYVKDSGEITLTNIIFGIFMIIISWAGAIILFVGVFVIIINWLYDEGNNIIIWRKSKIKKK